MPLFSLFICFVSPNKNEESDRWQYIDRGSRDPTVKFTLYQTFQKLRAAAQLSPPAYLRFADAANKLI